MWGVAIAKLTMALTVEVALFAIAPTVFDELSRLTVWTLLHSSIVQRPKMSSTLALSPLNTSFGQSVEQQICLESCFLNIDT